MLQLDGSRGNPCTCFMFMKPTDMVKELLVKWMQSIVDADSWYEDQVGDIADVPERKRQTHPCIFWPGRAAIDGAAVFAVLLHYHIATERECPRCLSISLFLTHTQTLSRLLPFAFTTRSNVWR